MSRVYTNEFITPKKMLAIPDILRKLKIDKVKMQFQFTNSTDLDIYKSLIFKDRQ